MINILVGPPASGKSFFLSTLPPGTPVFDEAQNLSGSAIDAILSYEHSDLVCWVAVQRFIILPASIRSASHNLFHASNGSVRLVSTSRPATSS